MELIAEKSDLQNNVRTNLKAVMKIKKSMRETIKKGGMVIIEDNDSNYNGNSQLSNFKRIELRNLNEFENWFKKNIY
ncbi:MAG: hypothetical protein NT007_13975 [Candidatus Kapabacteria bacterium]|nr:hypothetical protein [Candidatus Kapabacteria bacterium]